MGDETLDGPTFEDQKQEGVKRVCSCVTSMSMEGQHLKEKEKEEQDTGNQKRKEKKRDFSLDHPPSFSHLSSHRALCVHNSILVQRVFFLFFFFLSTGYPVSGRVGNFCSSLSLLLCLSLSLSLCLCLHEGGERERRRTLHAFSISYEMTICIALSNN